MNDTKIEWTHLPGRQGKSWNPAFGCNPDKEKQCHWCYGANKVAPRRAHACKMCGEYIFHFHPERLDQPFKEKRPCGIFVCSCAELFGPWVPRGLIHKVVDVAKKCPWHKFFFLSKFPEGMLGIDFPPNSLIGISVTGEGDEGRIVEIKKVKAPIRFISFEPLRAPVSLTDDSLKDIEWVILGKQTGKGARKPQKHWLEFIAREADRKCIPVFMKDNLKNILSPLRQEFPVS
jgi:protein gp37